MENILKNSKLFIFDTFFPIYCIRCNKELGKESNYICQKCLNQIEIRDFSCPLCEARLPIGKICKNCRKETGLTRFFASVSYKNLQVKNLIYRYKYEFAKILAAQLASIIKKSLKENFIDKEIKNKSNDFILIPIPLHKKRLRWRGFNQAELIASELSEWLKVVIQPYLLKRLRDTSPQADIKDKKEREENVAQAFLCTNPEEIEGKKIILVDDVYTTGETMKECARVLRKAGAREIWGIVVAKG